MVTTAAYLAKYDLGNLCDSVQTFLCDVFKLFFVMCSTVSLWK